MGFISDFSRSYSKLNFGSSAESVGNVRVFLVVRTGRGRVGLKTVFINWGSAPDPEIYRIGPNGSMSGRGY